MKKGFLQFGIIFVSLLFVLFSCEMNVEHVHTYSEEWTSNEINHWHVATCGHEEVIDIEEHTFSDWKVTKAATEEAECTKERICTVCNYREEKEVEHTFSDWKEKDVITLIRTCNECNYVAEMLNIENIKATNLPIVRINTKDGLSVTSKENWKDAKMEISNAADESWNFDDIEIEIRGRGNTTWSQPKKPYAIKLGKKQQICGMPKHKRWVLIANYLDNSFMKNEVAFYLSEQLGMDYTVRGEFVNLVLNDKYIGLYWLGEQIKVDENRVGIDEEKDYLVEMDVYYDETWKFKSEIKNLPYMIKNDDDMSQEKLDSLMGDINALERALYGEEEINLEDYIDVDSFAKFYIVNEIMGNGELNHPKSSYFTFNSSTKILSAGPVWDFDWAGASSSGSLKINNSIYYDELFTHSEFSEKVEELLALENLTVENIEKQIENMKSYISASAALDKLVWGVHKNPVGSQFNSFDEYVENLKLCVKTRLDFLKAYDF